MDDLSLPLVIEGLGPLLVLPGILNGVKAVSRRQFRTYERCGASFSMAIPFFLGSHGVGVPLEGIIVPARGSDGDGSGSDGGSCRSCWRRGGVC